MLQKCSSLTLAIDKMCRNISTNHCKQSLVSTTTQETEKRSKQMEVEKVLHMKQGVGDNSYAKNSLLQRTMLTEARPIIEESTRELYDTLKPECIMMAEMGCSSGPNTLLLVSKILDIINEASHSINRKCPQLGVFLNDLPGNDFNSLFSLLPSFNKAVAETRGTNFRPCFVSGIPKSFYGRVFPDNFLHLVHSSYSVHWLSQVPRGLASENGEPLNKGHIYIAKESPKEISKAYSEQFKADFTLFLRSRSREMVPRGRMVLVFVADRNRDDDSDSDSDSLWELLGFSLQDMVAKGVIEQVQVDRFDMPFYFPTVTEVRKVAEAEKALDINTLETYTVDWSVDTSQSLEKRAKFVSKTIRAVIEALLVTEFSLEAIDDLFVRFETRVKEAMAKGRSEFLQIVISMTRKD